MTSLVSTPPFIAIDANEVPTTAWEEQKSSFVVVQGQFASSSMEDIKYAFCSAGTEIKVSKMHYFKLYKHCITSCIRSYKLMFFLAVRYMFIKICMHTVLLCSVKIFPAIEKKFPTAQGAYYIELVLAKQNILNLKTVFFNNCLMILFNDPWSNPSYKPWLLTDAKSTLWCGSSILSVQ